MAISSEDLFERAERSIPGGVNSPVRAFGAVGGTPVFVRAGRGSRIVDVQGREYIDLVASWGPLILGHAHPAVVEAVVAAARQGTSFGAPTEAEVELAETVVERVPSVDKVRLVSSGTEAGMTASRLARGVTGRDRLLKFAGCYHGHSDGFLIQAGSGALTFGVPSSPGVPEATASVTHLARFNDLESVRVALEQQPGEFAAIIVEPVAGNMGTVPPVPGFLEGLRELSSEHGALLIFDEVITGFRVARGGAQDRYGILPDLTMMGKVLGGGLPLGAVGGPARILDQLSPSGPIYQAGTLSGNPLATAAGLATLHALDPAAYRTLEERAARLESGLTEAVARRRATVQRVGSLMTLFFVEGPVRDLESLADLDPGVYARFFHAMLERGVYLPPSQYEAWFVSLAHTDEDIQRVIEATREALAAI
ncbi:MAG: glutamate-1-semialdehyde 2,1-aminomutase [Planctomycetota bacterium]|nr:glutamate-1-semialdehyde 2,1-aminomutase [Planctomycetota bacterium]